MEASEPLIRDIDQIVTAVKQHIPEVTVRQWQKKHLSDNDGIWWFGLPGKSFHMRESAQRFER